MGNIQFVSMGKSYFRLNLINGGWISLNYWTDEVISGIMVRCVLEQKYSWSSDKFRALGRGQRLLRGWASLGTWASVRQQREAGQRGRGEAVGVLHHRPEPPLCGLKWEHFIIKLYSISARKWMDSKQSL